jgi:hypothetical protein
MQSINPYSSPSEFVEDRSTIAAARLSALRCVRVSLLILLVPGIYNFIWFHHIDTSNRTIQAVNQVLQILGGIGVALIAWAVWALGLAVLERLTGWLHRWCSRRADREAWETVLYQTLRRAPVLAFFGAILWALWVFGFYQLQIDFTLISVPTGILAHLLAAAIYLPLLYRWYRLERSGSLIP